MKKRPLAVTLVGWLYIALGAIGFAYHFGEVLPRASFQNDAIWIELVRLAAVLAGVYLLRGRNWARWLAIAWIGFHVILSAFHSTFELVMHSLFFVVLAFFLFMPASARYFQAAVGRQRLRPRD